MTWQSSAYVDRRGNWYPRMLVAKATYAEEPLSVSICIDTALYRSVSTRRRRSDMLFSVPLDAVHLRLTL